MKETYNIITFNAAGYGWTGTESWNNRFERICSYVSQKSTKVLCVGLQEVQLSGGKYLSVIEEHFPDYYIILPSAWKNQPKSAVSLLLLNKNIVNLEDCNVRTIPGLEDKLLYNYVHISCSGEELVLLNVHVPPNPEKGSEMYKMERKELRALFYTQIQRIAKSEPNLILLGDLNSTPNSANLTSLAYSENSPLRDHLENKNTPTWKENRIDYILSSRGLSANANIKATVDDTTITKKLSDHALLIAEAKNYA